jgi:hypothetical protein
MSCGSVWFVDAGSVTFIEKPISRRYLSQDDRIELADGLAAGVAGEGDRCANREELPERVSRDRP